MRVAGARMSWSAHLGMFYTCYLRCYTRSDANTDLTIHGATKVGSDRAVELRVQFPALRSVERSVPHTLA